MTEATTAKLPDGMHLAAAFDLKNGGYCYYVTGPNAPFPFPTFKSREEAIRSALAHVSTESAEKLAVRLGKKL